MALTGAASREIKMIEVTMPCKLGLHARTATSIDEIKKQHPEWVENSGVCKRCVMYYEEQLGGKSCQNQA